MSMETALPMAQPDLIETGERQNGSDKTGPFLHHLLSEDLAKALGGALVQDSVVVIDTLTDSSNLFALLTI